MAQIYLDNAASTPLLPEVLKEMQPYFLAVGNPSAVHRHGQRLRGAIEEARKEIALLLGAAPAEIFFTSGGTEANNWALRGAALGLGVREVLSSALEHASVREVLQDLVAQKSITLNLVPHDMKGRLHIAALKEAVARARRPTLLSFMHANNEIGNILPLEALEDVLEEGMYLHSDMVQSVGHVPIALGEGSLHMASASAHKFHGPRGIGFLYLRKGCGLAPLLRGGGQERNMRAGTEHVAAIVGMAAALRLVSERREEATAHITKLKQKLIRGLRASVPELQFNGLSAEKEQSLPKLLSVSFPACMDQESLLMCLDIAGISASVGSACASGAISSSHVLAALGETAQRISLRLSFSHVNTEAEVEECIEAIAKAIQHKSPSVSTAPL